MRNLFNRGRIWMLTVASGGGLFALETCDPNARDLVLGGVESAATGLASTLIQAFFQSLATDGEGTATTVRAIIENAAAIYT